MLSQGKMVTSQHMIQVHPDYRRIILADEVIKRTEIQEGKLSRYHSFPLTKYLDIREDILQTNTHMDI